MVAGGTSPGQYVSNCLLTDTDKSYGIINFFEAGWTDLQGGSQAASPRRHDESPVRFDQGMGMDGYGWVWNNWSMIAACRQIGKPGFPGAKEEASPRHRRPALRQYRILTGLVEVIERALAGDGA